MMDTNEYIELEFVNAQETLKKHYLQLNATLQYEHTPNDVKAFIIRVLQWRKDRKNGRQWLWELFHEAINVSDLNFLSSFNSFVVNSLLDDSAFRIEWRKNFVDENHNLVWLPGGGCKTVLTTKDDPRAEPVVVVDHNDGTQNVALLMEAMDHKEWEHRQRIEEEQEPQRLLSKLKGG
jgi:hypothetical protein